MPHGMEVGLSPGDFYVRWGPTPPQKGGAAPQIFGLCLLWQNGCMPLGTGVGLGPDDIVLDRDPAPLSKKGTESLPEFSAHVYSGQAGWIKMALGMEMGLGSGHTVLDSDPAPLLKKGAEPPIFGPFLLWPNGWMRQDATWYGACPQPRRLCVRWGPSPLPKKGAEPPFSAHVYSDQTAAWIKMPLGTEVGLRLRDIV